MDNSPVAQLKCMYTQLFNLNEEIKTLVTKGLINEAVQKSSQFDNLMSQIKFARMGMTIPEADKNSIKELETKAVVEIKFTMDSLIKIKNNLKSDLNVVNNNLKVKNAYSTGLPQTGQIIYEEE